MNRIRDWLYIGNYRDTLAPALIQQQGIGAVLHLIYGIQLPAEIATLCLAVPDGEPLPFDKLAQGVAFVRAQKAQGRTVMVACAAGVSRSVSFSMAVLHEEEQLSLLDAFKAIFAEHPHAMPHPALVASLSRYYNDPIKISEVWDVIQKVQ
ncbi:MAG: dual specificity protein phosphatase family protein [Chloroflexi bacterium]|nr:dual specificity protein phosphatase family protein [Chloroflexota bacterium]